VITRRAASTAPGSNWVTVRATAASLASVESRITKPPPLRAGLGRPLYFPARNCRFLARRQHTTERRSRLSVGHLPFAFTPRSIRGRAGFTELTDIATTDLTVQAFRRREPT